MGFFKRKERCTSWFIILLLCFASKAEDVLSFPAVESKVKKSVHSSHQQFEYVQYKYHQNILLQYSERLSLKKWIASGKKNKAKKGMYVKEK